MFVAECFATLGPAPCRDTLQWGRNMFVAECTTCLRREGRRDALQWGRNMFVAEWHSWTTVHCDIEVPSMGPQHVRCGMLTAAAHGSRKYHPSMGPQHVRCGMPIIRPGPFALFLILQWGRNMFVAEWWRPFMETLPTYTPSMGPQHVRCGMQKRSQCINTQ